MSYQLDTNILDLHKYLDSIGNLHKIEKIKMERSIYSSNMIYDKIFFYMRSLLKFFMVKLTLHLLASPRFEALLIYIHHWRCLEVEKTYYFLHLLSWPWAYLNVKRIGGQLENKCKKLSIVPKLYPQAVFSAFILLEISWRSKISKQFLYVERVKNEWIRFKIHEGH